MKRIPWLVILLVLLMQGFARGTKAYTNFPPDNPTVVIDSTNLPIVWIEVGGDSIMRSDVIGGRMKIIHNGRGRLNYGDTIAHPGQRIDYEGYIAIRHRGNTTYTQSPKKPYQFRTLSQPLEMGYDKKKVEILGMGKDNKWALLAPYSDRSMIRDLLAFEVARPWMEYTPQGRLCEVYLDGVYYGVHILCEVVSKGKHRLNLDDPGLEGNALTGGYLLEVGTNEGPIHISKYHPVSADGSYTYTDRFILFQFKSPDYVDMDYTQVSYINGAVDRMEDAFASPNFKDSVEGYRKYIDVQSFMDYQLVNELAHNVDAYRLGAKFYKRRDSIDSRFKMVIWDLNLGFGNCRHNFGWATNNWMSRQNQILYDNGDYMIPFWWNRLIKDNAYVLARRARWKEMRESNLQEHRLMGVLDSLANEVTRCGAEARNSQAWPRWGVWVWPNYYVSKSYQDEISFMKRWIKERVAWMDGALKYTPSPDPPDPPEPVKGDVNADGQVTIADVNVVTNIILGGAADKDTLKRADVNGDGEITLADIAAIIDILLSP